MTPPTLMTTEPTYPDYVTWAPDPPPPPPPDDGPCWPGCPLCADEEPTPTDDDD